MAQKILFIHQQPHPVHAEFASAIGAKFFFYDQRGIRHLRALSFFLGPSLTAPTLPAADVYLCEGGLPVAYAVAAKKQKNNNEARIIELAADETFVRLTAGIPRPMSFIERRRWSQLYAHIDAVIAVSTYIKEHAERVLACPIAMANPFIQKKRYAELRELRPRLDTHAIVSIGHAYPKNGMDVLIDAFIKIKKRVPDAELYVIGRGHSKQFEKYDGVHILGFLDEKALLKRLEMASLAVLVGRGQAFPVSTLESLCAGVPTLVTEHTGTKEVIAELGAHFFRAPDAEDVAEGILEYFESPPAEKKQLSEKSRLLAARFTEEERVQRFAETFRAVLEALQGESS